MHNTTITQLPPAGSADPNAVVASDNAAGTETQKVTLGQIAALAAYDQSLNTTDNVTFASVALPNGTQITEGSWDNGTGGQNGISIHCYVGYELNWQGGRLCSSPDGGTTYATIWCDSPIQWQGEAGNLTIDATGITFPDGTTQASAPRKFWWF